MEEDSPTPSPCYIGECLVKLQWLKQLKFRAQFHKVVEQKAVKQKILLVNFLLSKHFVGHQPQQCKLYVIMAGYLFLLS